MKNLRGIKFISALTAIFMTAAVSAQAAVIDKAVYNINTDTITVSGNTQEVDRTLLSENLLTDGSCDEIGAWKVRGGTATNSPNAALEPVESSYLKLINRELYYTGISHSIYDILSENGFGTYRVSGRVKALDKTISDTLVQNGKVNVILMTQGDQYILAVKNVSEEWVDFEGDLTIDSYGYSGTGDSKVYNTAWPTGASQCIMYIETTNALDSSGNNLKDSNNNVIRDTRDLCIDDFSIQYVGERDIYEGVEAARISVTDAQNRIVYVNEALTDAAGNYSISLKLPDDADRDSVYVAHVSGENTDGVVSKSITPLDVRSKIKTEYSDGKAYVKFDIFDFFDSDGISNVKAIAGSYTADDALYKVKVSNVSIDLDTAVNQEIAVDVPEEEGSYVKLLLWNDLSKMIPLCKIHSDQNAPAKLILVGDSIVVAYKPEAEPQHGWGEYIGGFFSDKLTVVNCAHGGYSTATFMDPENYHAGYSNAHTWNSTTVNYNDTMVAATPILPMIEQGDYVMVSLGINDMSSQNGRYTDEATYKSNLKKMAEDTIAKGANIIFVTPTTNAITTGGQYLNRYSERGDWMKEVAAEVGATCIDLGTAMTDLYNTEGVEKVKHYHLFREVLLADVADGGYGMTEEQLSNHTNAVVKGGGDDKVHLSDKGASMVAGLIAGLLAQTDDGITAYIAK